MVSIPERKLTGQSGSDSPWAFVRLGMGLADWSQRWTSEALPNLINPFWMLPLLGLLKVKARDLIGYGLLYFAVNSVVVLFLMWFFARTMVYVPPAIL
jgi:hypothetical protein